MTVDLARLRKRISQLEKQVKELRRIADEATQNGAVDAKAVIARVVGLGILCPRPDRVAAYLWIYPDVANLVTGLADALVREFDGERSEIELDLHEDPEIDDQYLQFMVRKPTYEDGFVDRLLRLMRKFHDERRRTSGWVMASTDFRPLVTQ
jgi:hypothetical protein